ncbi:MAG: hypothetical protein LAO77_00975 [Acidobacteriia bacterium]|nr:hypothetical protein [Terriglobia bacterium]
MTSVNSVKGCLAIFVGGTLLAPATAGAQSAAAAARISAEQRQSRYQIGQMERVVEGAVEHGAAVTRDRLQAVLPPNQTSMTGENAQARGFRLEGYGVFFDVIVPPFYTESTLAWSLRTLDQNDLGLESALRQLRLKAAGDTDAEQALKRIELQMGPAVLARSTAPAVAGARDATGSVSAAGVGTAPPASGGGDRTVTSASTRSVSAASVTPPAPAPAGVDPILEDPNEAYRTEVTQALKDVMLDYSASLGIGPDEWLTIAAKGNDDRPRLAPADSDAHTRVIRLRGSDLAAYLARQITREEALKRIEVRVF